MTLFCEKLVILIIHKTNLKTEKGYKVKLNSILAILCYIHHIIFFEK